jgi:hypothetical protein
MGGVDFLTPYDALFALAAAVPIAALLLAQRRAAAVRRLFSLPQQRARGLAAGIAALALVPSLVGVAAAQPVIVRQRPYSQRGDAQVFFVFDTSLSMSARAAPRAPSRLARAKREALELAPELGDIPAGVASLTDRTLPVLMPTTDLGLFERTVRQSIGIDRPPPSQLYRDRATSLSAIASIGQTQFFPPSVRHPIVVVFTDGESSRLPTDFQYTLQQEAQIMPFLVHVSAPGEHVYAKGKIDERYVEDPASGTALDAFARITHGRVFRDGDVAGLDRAIHAAAGPATSHTSVTQYARIALAPWFVLAAVVPLGFLLWRRNL